MPSKIHSLAFPYALLLNRPLRTSREAIQARSLIGVKLEAEDNFGIGTALCEPGIQDTSLQALNNYLAESGDFSADTQKTLPLPAQTAINLAQMDLNAKSSGVSFGTLLAARAAIPKQNCISELPLRGLLIENEPESLKAETSELVKAGYKSFKLKIGYGLDDLARLRAVRQAAPKTGISLDANAAFSYQQAFQVAEKLLTFEPEYIEEPFSEPADNLRAEKSFPLPIAADESLRSFWNSNISDSKACLDKLFNFCTVDIMVIKPTLFANIELLFQMALRALAAKKRIIVSSAIDGAIGLLAALHFAAALPNEFEPVGLDTSKLLKNDIAKPPALLNGKIQIPKNPGLGAAQLKI